MLYFLYENDSVFSGNKTAFRSINDQRRMETFVIQNPEEIVVQADGRIKKWAKITEAGKFLRVILLEDGETVHNAFFDRSFGGKTDEG